jgi:L-threonylcarbamoyladenylate synthase
MKAKAKDLGKLLLTGGVAVLPTDTLYGICGSALKPQTVRRIYRLRKRNLKKPMIVLISSLADLAYFGVKPSREQLVILKKYWPGKVSIVMPVASKRLEYLHRGKKSIAFRLPDNAKLRTLLKKSGPLVAPTANYEGETPAHTIAEAIRYFSDDVNCYVDGGRVNSKPSTLIELDQKGKITILREGAVGV